MFDLCSVFEAQTQLSLVFATVKALQKNLEIVCSLVIYAPNFKQDFLSKKSAYNTRQNTVTVRILKPEHLFLNRRPKIHYKNIQNTEQFTALIITLFDLYRISN